MFDIMKENKWIYYLFIQLVAPSIYEKPCQEALLKSADNLSEELRAFTDSWKPFSTDPHHAKTIRELGKEADNLERILEGGYPLDWFKTEGLIMARGLF